MKLNEINALVTGSAGFIGSTLCEKLLNYGCNVTGLDNFNDYYQGKNDNISKVTKNENFTQINGDILNFENLSNAMANIDLVFHLAAQPGVRFSLENPTITNKINTEGTLNVLEAAKKNNVKKFINASSSSIYGNPNYTPVDEEHPLQPISIYGVSKLAAEKYCFIYSKLYDFEVVSLRYHTVYGPRGRPDMAIFKWVDSLFNKKPIILFGDGNQTRDMTYVDDIVNGTILASITENISGESFNLASGRRVSMNFVIEQLSALTKMNPEINYEKLRIDDAKDTHGNIDKAKKILGYEPKTSIENGLKLTIDWYKQQFQINS